MADLIITNGKHVDTSAIAEYTLDCAWGSGENDFELTVPRLIDSGAYVYLDGSECGGIVDAMEDQLTSGVSTITYSGRTWHGVLADKILEPDKGKDYLTVSGSASSVIGSAVGGVIRCSARLPHLTETTRPSKPTSSTVTWMRIPVCGRCARPAV